MARIFLAHSPDMLANYYGERALAGISALGDVTVNESGGHLGTEMLIAAAAGCEIIVSDRMTPGEADLFDNSPDLVAFLRCAVDIRTVDVAAASAAGVLVTNASPGFVDSVSELILGCMVDLGRHVTAAATAYHDGGVPEARMGVQLAGATMGVIGYGAIGRRMTDLGKVLGMTVLVTDPYATVTDANLTRTDLDTLLAESDFVVCLAVATEETENLMDAAAFARMKPGAFFVNASRGNLVDEAALEDVLRNGHLAGAAMDVGRAPDQMPTPALAALPTVIATPHIGGLTPQAIEAQALETVEQVRALVEGRLPHNAVNAEAATRLTRLGIGG